MSEFVDVREPGSGKLLFRFDLDRGIIQVQRRGVVTLIDLSEFRQSDKERQEHERNGTGEGYSGSPWESQ